MRMGQNKPFPIGAGIISMRALLRCGVAFRLNMPAATFKRPNLAFFVLRTAGFHISSFQQ
jgi:hypothetical protein